VHELLARSFVISADMAHAVHPNYSDNHDECHRPQINQGVVIKYNSNLRYSTTSRSSAVIKILGANVGVPIQEFMVRNDSPCGTTIGPIVSARLGLQAVDIGLAQLGMHSIRETAGVADIEHGIKLLKGFFEMNPVNVLNE
jgi:aspartyl aminopeptidase